MVKYVYCAHTLWALLISLHYSCMHSVVIKMSNDND